MLNTRRQFIIDNRKVLETYHSRVSEKFRVVTGFGGNTPRDCFQIILSDGDDYYLAACLLHIFWDFDNIADRNFVLKSLENLYKFDESGNISDPEMAYVYAYCLQHTDASVESMGILTKLADQCFSPALATIGDSCVTHLEIKTALSYYAHAKTHGYMSVTFRRNKIAFKDLSLLKQIPIRLILIFVPVFRARKIIKKGIVGSHMLYLDFYGIKHHLNKYWKIPKFERIQKLKES